VAFEWRKNWVIGYFSVVGMVEANTGASIEKRVAVVCGKGEGFAWQR
jgi:hypothetical protein